MFSHNTKLQVLLVSSHVPLRSLFVIVCAHLLASAWYASKCLYLWPWNGCSWTLMFPCLNRVGYVLESPCLTSPPPHNARMTEPMTDWCENLKAQFLCHKIAQAYAPELSIGSGWDLTETVSLLGFFFSMMLPPLSYWFYPGHSSLINHYHTHIFFQGLLLGDRDLRHLCYDITVLYIYIKI